MKEAINLLTSRYKIIADYPGNQAEVSDIFQHFAGNSFILKGVGLTTNESLDKYPHLFRKLEWWEERKVEEMPEYVKIAENRPSYKLPNNCIRSCTWQKTINECGFICDSFPVYLDVKGLLPATEQEYLSYIEGLKK